jgi:hypothetical protein
MKYFKIEFDNALLLCETKEDRSYFISDRKADSIIQIIIDRSGTQEEVECRVKFEKSLKRKPHQVSRVHEHM